MTITKQIVANQIAAYLHHEITLERLVHWAEVALLEGEFAEDGFDPITEVVSRLGVADTRAFGLTWEDCEALLRRLGFASRVEVVAA